MKDLEELVRIEFCFKFRANATETEIVESSFWRGIGRTQVLSGFSNFKIGVTLLKMPNTHHLVKQMKMCPK